MDIRKNLSFFALGSVCTLVGMLFATMSPLFARRGEDVVYDTIQCKKLFIMEGENPVAVLGSNLLGAFDIGTGGTLMLGSKDKIGVLV